MRLRKKVAIITGAGAGIGKATAELFAEEGAKVVVADIDAKTGEETVRTICQAGGNALFVHADISRECDARRIAETTVASYGRIDVLVNNAAAFVLKGFCATAEEWQLSLGTNVVGTATVTRYAVESMKKTGGSIVNVSSISGFVAQPDFFAYSATKAAIIQMSRNMSLDLGPFKIRVNCVCPGGVLTEASYDHSKKIGLTVEAFNRRSGAKTFLGRMGLPREVAHAILFLASDDASYITGASLIVDGGYMAV